MLKDNINNTEKKKSIIVIALSVVLAVMLILYFTERSQHNEVLSEMGQEKDSLQIELQRISVGYDSLTVENDTLTQSLQMASEQVRQLLTEVEQTKKASYKQISRYRKEVTTLRKIMRNYIVQIDSLNKRNAILLAENNQVKQKIAKVSKKNEKLSQSNEELKEQISIAATLEAQNIKAIGINKKGKENHKARKIEKLKITCTLSKNVTAKRGEKNIYIRIMDPFENLLVEEEDNTFKYEDSKIQYSAVRSVNYEGEALPIAIYWDNTNKPPLSKGKYVVHLFTDGNNIGETSLEIK
ncbi:hypothetical protein K5X82_11630 [Halosquirtibacter xylanolyticus]|uniref:hypothetical protein n=1 Tax=Halosquirtibacter xylanolyticus TaxID=3374599 RepID=UPI00374A716E|nr:hypothetical protein K5X82_11630 [Prolixibacteraceae bacterium]